MGRLRTVQALELELDPQERRELMRLGSALAYAVTVIDAADRNTIAAYGLVARADVVRDPHPYGKP